MLKSKKRLRRVTGKPLFTLTGKVPTDRVAGRPLTLAGGDPDRQ
jgi:hypothetical protein